MSDDALERRFPRRLLLGGGAAAAALAATQVVRPAPAAAAPTSTPWRLGGNADVTTDGTNWLGPTNVAPLIFKTGKANNTQAERMRIASNGRVGIGTTAPSARLDVRGTESTAVQGVTSVLSGIGVRGESPGGYGVYGVSSGGHGVYGESTGDLSAGTGVIGFSAWAGVQGTGQSFGGRFFGDGPDGVGVLGSGAGTGVYATSGDADLGRAVHGVGGQYGVVGAGGRTGGVRGESTNVGVWGDGASYGMYAAASAATGTTYGLAASVASPNGYAVYANGRVHVNGTLSKAAGSFRIDHPLDPTNRWLSHSFVESPDMMNVYNGNVVLSADGTAVVELPDYFDALNRDFRYQLTCIGGHAPVYIAAKVTKGRFTIAGGNAGLEVSWQVTGIRKDDYATAHPIVVDTPKAGKERGTRDFVPSGVTATRFSAEPVD